MKDQLTPKYLYGFWGKRRFVALDLYDSYEGSTEDISKFQEHAIGRLAVVNGAFKKTHKDRFNTFDESTLSLIRERFQAGLKLKVHDMAVSDGRTSVPFYKSLSSVYEYHLDFLASDFSAEFFVVKETGSSRRIVLDNQGNLIQYIFPPFVFNMIHPENPYIYPINYLACKILYNTFATKLQDKYKCNPNLLGKEKILLLSPECKVLLADKRFAFRSYDMLSAPLGKFQVIRAMNILNASYFKYSELKRAVDNILCSLDEGGILITGSNVDTGSTVNGGVYLKNNGDLQKIFESGEGSPIKEILESVSSANPAA